MASDYKIVFNRDTVKFEIESNVNYSAIPDIVYTSDVIGGVKLEVDTGNGYATMYDNSLLSVTNYLVYIDITNPNGTAQDVQVSLPQLNGVNLVGDYKFTFYETVPTSGGTYNREAEVIFTYSGEVSKSICLQDSVKCSAPLVSVSDTADYTYNGVVPTENTGVLTLGFPATSNQDEIVVTEEPFSINTNIVWTGGYLTIANRNLLYDFDDYSEEFTIDASLTTVVKCDSLCGVYSCVKSLRAEINENKGTNTVKYNSLLEDYNEVMSLAEQADMAVSCGDYDSVDGLIEEMKTVLNTSSCTSNCSSDCSSDGVSKRIYGIGSVQGSSEGVEVSDGILSVSASKINVGEGLTLTELITGEATIVAEVTQAELDAKLPLAGGTLTGALTGISAEFTDALTGTSAEFTDVLTGTSAEFTDNLTTTKVTAGDGNDYAAELKSSTGSRGLRLLDNTDTEVGSINWDVNGDIIFKRGSDDAETFKILADKSLVALGNISGTSAEFNGIVKLFNGSGLPVDMLRNDSGDLFILGNLTSSVNIESLDKPYWTDGASTEFLQTTSGGLASARPSSPEQYEQYADTDIGALIIFIGSDWVMANDFGIIV